MKIHLPFSKKNILVFASSIFISLFSLSINALPSYAVTTQSINAFPTHATDTDPRTKSWFIYSLPAGEIKADSVTVVNNASTPITLKVYPVDSIKASDGSFALAQENAPRKDVGAWVTMSAGQITLNPKEQREIPFTITIPTDASRDEHSGGIIFEETTPKTVTQKGMNIHIISRVGVRIYETVPGPEQLSLAISKFNYTTINNHLTFSFTAENNGTVHISPTGVLEIKDMFGRVIKNISLNKELDIIVPGQPVNISIPTDILSPILSWDTATVTLNYAPTKSAIASIIIIGNPWITFGALFIILFIVILFIFRKKLISTPRKNKNAKVKKQTLLIVTMILLGAIIFSGMISFLLTYLFS